MAQGGFGDEIKIPKVQFPRFPGGAIKGIVAAIILLIVAVSSFYTVEPEEIGADEAQEVTGYARGTITPLGATNPWPVIADAALDGEVSLGGGAHGVSIAVRIDALVAALAAEVADVTDPA